MLSPGTQKTKTTIAPAYTKVFAQSLIAEAKRWSRCCHYRRYAIRNRTRFIRTGIPRTLLWCRYSQLNNTQWPLLQAWPPGTKTLCCDLFNLPATRRLTKLSTMSVSRIYWYAFAYRPVQVWLAQMEQPTAFDTAYLSCLPNMVLMVPSDEQELINMVAQPPPIMMDHQSLSATRAAKAWDFRFLLKVPL